MTEHEVKEQNGPKPPEINPRPSEPNHRRTQTPHISYRKLVNYSDRNRFEEIRGGDSFTLFALQIRCPVFSNWREF